jgi:hypothetical protein
MRNIKMQIKYLSVYLVFLAAVIYSFNTRAADINAHQVGNNKIYSIDIIGEIREGDFNQLISTIKAERYFPFSISIRSKGGSVTEAVKISKFINEALVPVNAIDYCYSSCFYIWVASIERNVLFEGMSKASVNEIANSKVIGLHRPYFDKSYFSSLSMKDAQAKQHELETQVRSYLKSLNVHEKWIDEMMMHSSDDIRLVTRRELENEFGFTSHAFEEWLLAKCPINRDDLLIGKIEMAMRATGADDSKVKLSREQRNNAFNEYMKYSECRKSAIEQSQTSTLKSILQ